MINEKNDYLFSLTWQVFLFGGSGAVVHIIMKLIGTERDMAIWLKVRVACTRPCSRRYASGSRVGDMRSSGLRGTTA